MILQLEKSGSSGGTEIVSVIKRNQQGIYRECDEIALALKAENLLCRFGVKHKIKAEQQQNRRRYHVVQKNTDKCNVNQGLGVLKHFKATFNYRIHLLLLADILQIIFR